MGQAANRLHLAAAASISPAFHTQSMGPDGRNPSVSAGGAKALFSFAEVQPERRKKAWHCLISACASCLKQAFTSATRPTAGTRKCARYIFGERNNVHIIDLAQTVPLLHQALKVVCDTVAGGGRVLFVGTKRQASEIVADAAKRSAQYYVNARWLGGMLTNWKTISNSIQRLRKLDETLAARAHGLHQEGAPQPRARARQARPRARRHPRHGRHAGPDVRHRHQQGSRSPSRKPSVLAFRSWRSSIRTATRTRSTTRSRAMTMPRAPYRSIAT